MQNVSIPINPQYGHASLAIVGLVEDEKGRWNFVLVDEPTTGKLKFPGYRFRFQGRDSVSYSLEDMARSRFEEQTGLEMEQMFGIRRIVSTRTRNGWAYKNVAIGKVKDLEQRTKPDGDRNVFLLPREFKLDREIPIADYALTLDERRQVTLDFANEDNYFMAELAHQALMGLQYDSIAMPSYDLHNLPPITCVNSYPHYGIPSSELGVGLSVASMIVEWKENSRTPTKLIMVRRKDDDRPGFPGGKVETLVNANSVNSNPIAACLEEGIQELGFEVMNLGLIGIGVTPLHVSGPDFYNSLVNYCFLVRPQNPMRVREALKNPRNFLEHKMAEYVLMTREELRYEAPDDGLRTPDMFPLAMLYLGTKEYKPFGGHQLTPSSVFEWSGTD